MVITVAGYEGEYLEYGGMRNRSGWVKAFCLKKSQRFSLRSIHLSHC